MVPQGWRKWNWETLIGDLYANCDLHPSGCLIWRGSVDKDGYAKIYIDSRHWRASRALLKAVTGELHPVARHSCDTPPCLNRRHLLWGTYQDNVLDSVERNRWPTGDNHHMRKNPGTAIGEKNANSKLTLEQVNEIRQSRMQKPRVKVKDLAVRYKVSKSAIEGILYGHSWK